MWKKYLLLIFCVIVVACGKDDPIETRGNIYGRVTEDVSNESIVASQVSISDIQQSVSTGQDGIYQFTDLTAGSYSLTASKPGFLTDIKSITVVAGQTTNGDFSLEKELPTIIPTTVSLNNATTEITLQLQNTRSSVMNFTTELSQDWLEVSPSNSSIDPLNTKLLTLSADLQNVPFGNYEEVLVINVGQASLSVPITVNYSAEPNISITSPQEDETYVMGEVMPISWNSNLQGNVKLELMRLSSIFLNISNQETNDNGGNYSWEIPALVEDYYQLKITSIENLEVFEISDTFQFIEGPTKPTVINGGVTELQSTSIKIQGEITNIGLQAEQVDQYGHVYSQTNTNPTISDFKTNLGNTSTPIDYESEIIELVPGETYYVNAYAINFRGVSYGEVKTITPPGGVPIVTTTNVTNITTNSAQTGGNVISDGGNNLTERGICWSTTSPVNIDSNTVQDGQNTEGTFTINLTSLNPVTTYYIRAYAINSEGVGYGDQINFNTSTTLPSVETISATAEDTNTISVVGNIIDNGGVDLNSYGFVYSMDNASPTLDDTILEIGQNSLGQFNGQISDLQPSTNYFIRAYATNQIGTSYGSVLNEETEEGNYLTIVSPSENELIDTNTNYSIQWESNFSENERLIIEHYRDGQMISELTNNAFVNQNEYLWQIPIDMPASSNNQLKVFLYDTLELIATSYNFQINNSFYLTSPQSGDQFCQDNVIISWGINYSTNLMFELLSGSTNLGVIDINFPSGTQQYDWDAVSSDIQIETNTNYRIKITDQINQTSLISDEFSTTGCLPILTTIVPSDITFTTATSGGNITDEGGVISEIGVVWDTNNNPTITSNLGITYDADPNGTGLGNYYSNISSLNHNTTYYVRAYATNSFGTSYGQEEIFTTPKILNVPGPILTDIDGNNYETVQIGDQIWTKQNLNVSRYRNGALISHITDYEEWADTEWGRIGAWCYYNNNSSNGSTYGKLYNWYTVDSPNELAPEGYHIPSAEEWDTLINYLDGTPVAGEKMKNWDGASNISGFTGLPGGSRSPGGSFASIGSFGFWWSTDAINYGTSNEQVKTYYLRSDYDDVPTSYVQSRWGRSVRLIKD